MLGSAGAVALVGILYALATGPLPYPLLISVRLASPAPAPSSTAIAAVPLIVVSADALPAQIEPAMAAGALRYLTKPVNVSEVLRILDELLHTASTRSTE